MLRPGGILSRTAVRLALEAAVIVAAAVAIALNDPTIGRVIVVMLPTYLLVAGAEWFISRRLRSAEAAKAAASSPAPPGTQPPTEPAVQQPEHVRVVTPSPSPAAAEAAETSVAEPDQPVETEPEQPVEPEPVPVAETDGVPDVAPAAPVEPIFPPLVAVPTPVAVAEPPEPDPAVEIGAETPVDPTVVQLPMRGPRAWNLWDLERLSRADAGRDSFRDEERAYLLVYLREFASADGELPIDFDGLVRESFGDLVTTG